MFTLLATALNFNTIFDLMHVTVEHSPSHITLFRINMVASSNAIQMCKIPVGMATFQQKNRSSVSPYLRKPFTQGYT